MPQREWTGSVAVLPQAMRQLANACADMANEPDRDPKPEGADVERIAAALAEFLRDEAYTLSEWADAIEQLYARLDEGDPITNAQMVKLGQLMRNYKADRAIVLAPRKGEKLLAFDLTERGAFLVNGGIEPNGSAHT